METLERHKEALNYWMRFAGIWMAVAIVELAIIVFLGFAWFEAVKSGAR